LLLVALAVVGIMVVVVEQVAQLVQRHLYQLRLHILWLLVLAVQRVIVIQEQEKVFLELIQLGLQILL
jgi:hypothetical protein